MKYKVYKYIANGESGYTRAPNIAIAYQKIFRKYLKLFGRVKISDIKQVKPPIRERYELQRKISGSLHK